MVENVLPTVKSRRQEEVPRPAAARAGAGPGNQSASRDSDTSISEIETRARRYMQEKSEAAEYPKAGTAAATAEGIGGVKQSSPKLQTQSFSRTNGTPQAGQASKKVVDTEASTTPPNNSSAGGASKGRGNPFVAGSDLRCGDRRFLSDLSYCRDPTLHYSNARQKSFLCVLLHTSVTLHGLY